MVLLPNVQDVTPLYPADATCGDLNGATEGTTTFSNCGNGKEYDTNKVAEPIGTKQTEAEAAVVCCKVSTCAGYACRLEAVNMVLHKHMQAGLHSSLWTMPVVSHKWSPTQQIRCFVQQ